MEGVLLRRGGGPWGTRFQINPPAADCNAAYPSTGHVGSMVVAMADASARTVGKDISVTTWRALCTPAGNDKIGDDF